MSNNHNPKPQNAPGLINGASLTHSKLICYFVALLQEQALLLVM
jgi:hypothetical protein